MKASREKSVIFSWILTYALILIIPLSCFAYSSIRLTKVYKQQINDANDHSLSVFDDSLQSIISDVTSASSFIITQKEFSSFARAKTEGEMISKAYALMDMLNSYTQNSTSGVTYMIYHGGYDYVLTPQCGTNAYSASFVQQSKGDDAQRQNWLDLIRGKIKKPYYFVSEMTRWKDEQISIVYAFSINLYSDLINIFVSVPITDLRINGFEDQFMFLIEKNGNVLYESMEGVITSNYGENILNSMNNGELKIKGKRYIANKVTIGKTEISCILLTSWEEYWGAVYRVNVLLITVFLVSIVAVIPVTIISVNKNYQPVKDILKSVDNDVVFRNEFKRIEQTILSMRRESDNLQEVLLEQKEQLKTYYLLSALKGRKLILSEEEYLWYFGIDETGGKWAVILLTLSDTGCDESYDALLERENATFAVIDSINKKIVDYPHEWLEDGKLNICLMHLTPDNEDDWKKDGANILRKLTQYVSEHFTGLKIILCDPVQTLLLAGKLYREAVDAVIYQQTVGQSGFMTLAEYRKVNEYSNTSLEEDRTELLNAIRLGDITTAEDLAERYIGIEMGDGASLSISKMRIAVWLDSLVKQYYEYSNRHEFPHDLLRKVELILTSTDFEQIKTEFVEIVQALAKDIYQQNIGLDDGLISKIIEYVQANYSSDNLNISTISDKFERHPQTISRIFRNKMGIGLLDYISSFRIQKAQDLMKQDSSLTVEEVAIKVGFTNVRTFRRAFVKTFGTLPSTYTKEIRTE